MSERLDGQVTLVTGAASGIGKGIARRFVAEGARSVVVDIQDEPGLEFGVNGAVLVVDADGEVVGDRNGRFVEMDTRLVSEAGQTP
ncbi:MAG TPA: SDR family NAD(P)-dependent oxidoreductase [Jatrophihabitantaceae bacterium]|nr:SDR family NAD(P)-dependent oxidoreductase [Jatrophihabitantaceae bacterium]